MKKIRKIRILNLWCAACYCVSEWEWVVS